MRCPSFNPNIFELKKQNGRISQLSEDYVEKLRLQIPDNMNKLLVDVTLSLLGKSSLKPWESEKLALYIEKADKKEYGGMFEAVIESIKEGQEEAREEEHKESMETVARKALKKGLPHDVIQDITGLDVEAIQNLSRNWMACISQFF